MVTCNKYLRTASGILKIAETVTVATTFGLFRGIPLTFGSTHHFAGGIGTDTDFFAGGAMVTALIVTPLFFVFYLLGRNEIRKTGMEVLLNFILGVFLFVSGSLCLAFYNSTPLPSPWNSKKKEGIAMGVFCYISASFYVADTFVAIRNFCRKETETDA
ncbi:protein snakeskin [Penaeus vannamei]|uniref:protein snakeskin n=1 Tax=Penaeus vannamei TaxID=6689 RepID=UPI00387F9D7B